MTTISRRSFIKRSALGGAGLVIGFNLPPGFMRSAAAADAGTVFAPNAFLRITPDDAITVIIKHLEMGQGVYTGLSQILAEELDANWAKIGIETAPADAARYNNLSWGPAQGTGGSSSIANSWDQLRQAGAQARAMLIAAAAAEWDVPAVQLVAENSVVSDTKSEKRATYGQLAERAALLEPPANVTVKSNSEFKLIGTSPIRLDAEDKSNGKAIFAIDVQQPGALTALVARAPRFGGKMKSLDDKAARDVPGVRAVVTIPEGVAVVADGFWAAKKARDVLEIEWEEGEGSRATTKNLYDEYAALAAEPGNPARNDGDIDKALEKAPRKLEATFTFPYLAHAPMEPLTCVVKLQDDGLDVWAGAQQQTLDQANAAGAAGLRPDQVRIHTVLAGGSFGRRASPPSDYIVEAVNIAKATRDLDAPIRLIWTREDDIRGGRYRPQYLHALSAGMDPDGSIVAWRHRIVGQSILIGTPFESVMVKNGIDVTSVEGASTLPYEIPNLRVDLTTTTPGIPVLWWRSVGSTHTAYSTEVFLDELAHEAGRDPLELRRELLKKHPRHVGALNLAAEKAGWGETLPKGRGRGLAVHEAFNTFVAQVVEVTVDARGKLKVDRVVCAVDCGIAINPEIVKAQMEGGIGFGLGAALHGEITMVDGIVQQSNFHDYPVLRMNEMPRVEVHIVPSREKPTGVGEPGVPPIAPALANAIFAATGKRIRRLPIGKQDFGTA